MSNLKSQVSAIKRAVEAVRHTLDQECREMKPEDYKQVLEEVATDIEGNLDALRDENPELFRK